MITINFKEIIELYNSESQSMSYEKKLKLNNVIKNLNKDELNILRDYEDFFKKLLNKYNYVEFFKYLKKLKLKYYEINHENIEDYFNKDKKYKVKKKLGQGSFGSVYLVEKNKKNIAFKVEYAGDYVLDKVELIKNFIDRILNEYKIGKKTGLHKITPKYFNLNFFYNHYDNKILSIIEMEAIKGVPLNLYLNKKKKLNKIESAILENKINKLHKLNITHGDLHSGNIMVVKNNKKIDIFLIDLGFSRTKKGQFEIDKKINFEFIKKVVDSKNKKDNISDLNELEIMCYHLYKNKKLNLIF